MNSVISAEQARSITGGRKPLVPIEYETATKALTECISIDDAKYWVDKADALAAWAKIYRDDVVGRKAKALKLHAYRRMGQLASELRPHKHSPKGGPSSLLKENGLSGAKADSAMILSRLPEERFQTLVNAPHPISPTAIRYQRESNIEDSPWREFYRIASAVRALMRRRSAREIAEDVSAGEREGAIRLVTDLSESLDDLHSRLKR